MRATRQSQSPQQRKSACAFISPSMSSGANIRGLQRQHVIIALMHVVKDSLQRRVELLVENQQVLVTKTQAAFIFQQPEFWSQGLVGFRQATLPYVEASL